MRAELSDLITAIKRETDEARKEALVFKKQAEQYKAEAWMYKQEVEKLQK